MKRILFIDRDGTLIVEPKEDQQIDSLAKFEIIPGAITALKKLIGAGFHLVMVTNQDGLGTQSFPEDTFWPYQNLLLDILKSEEIEFLDILIDRSFERDGKETRKPGIGMVKKYLTEEFDLHNSFVIGDRKTDVQLAKNMGVKSIFFGEQVDDADLCSTSWDQIARYLTQGRQAAISRETSETMITINLNLDGSGKAKISTGLGFFDHMLTQVAYHGMLDMEIECKGDLHIDEHHTVEDVALVLGEAFSKALQTKKGIYRYGFVLPMDESCATVSIDFSGRPWLVWNCDFQREKIGDMSTEMFMHFFKSFTDTAKATLNIQVTGSNEHHKIESIFKAFGRAIRWAISLDPKRDEIPSTKGVL